MKYDFDRIINRKGTNSLKWDYSQQRIGVDEVLPMWVADMDFESPPSVRNSQFLLPGCYQLDEKKI